jgi:hypothetical protein
MQRELLVKLGESGIDDTAWARCGSQQYCQALCDLLIQPISMQSGTGLDLIR